MIKFLPSADHVHLKLSHEFVVANGSVRIRVYHDGYVLLDSSLNLEETIVSSVILHVTNTYDDDMRFMQVGSPKKFYQHTGILAGTVAKYTKRAILNEFNKHKHWKKVFTNYSHVSGRSKSRMVYGAFDVITDPEVEEFCDRAVKKNMIPLYVLFGISSESEAYGFLPEDLQLYFQTQSYTRNRMIVAKAIEHYDRDYNSIVKILRNLISIPSSTIKYSSAGVHNLQAFGLIWKHMNDEFRNKYSKAKFSKLFKAVYIAERFHPTWNKALDFVADKNISLRLDDNLRFNTLDDMHKHLYLIIKQSRKTNKTKG